MSASASIHSGSRSARGNNNGVDRLSSLCDELLHHVMSFLPMPEVVRTSLLSPRWRYLWASTPFIHIDYKDFKHERNPRWVDVDKLKKFGDHLLLLRDGAVSSDETQIFAHSVDSTTCSVWIRHAIMHKARLLHVSGLRDHVILDSGAMFPSRHLKIIKLQSLVLRHSFIRPLNHDCHVIEYLELEECSLCDLKDMEISSRSLKVLRIIRCLILNCLLICARNLTHLSILDPKCHLSGISRSGGLVTRGLDSLVSASISLRSREFHLVQNEIMDHRLLDGLSLATTLELHAPSPELAFVRGLQTCPMFSNLTSLVLGDWCMTAEFYPLHCILQRSGKLKELSFKLRMEECRICKDAVSALSPLRGVTRGSSYPCIQTIKVYCRKDDPRVGTLLQALLPIVGDGKISIQCY